MKNLMMRKKLEKCIKIKNALKNSFFLFYHFVLFCSFLKITLSAI